MEPILVLERACYPPPMAYGSEEYRYALVVAHAVNLKMEEAGRMVGFVGAFLHAGWRTGNVYTVNVHPDARGRGLGRLLMAGVEDAMRRAGMGRSVLEVNVGNAAGIALYAACGYKRVGRIADYYSSYRDPDAYRYEKDLA